MLILFQVISWSISLVPNISDISTSNVITYFTYAFSHHLQKEVSGEDIYLSFYVLEHKLRDM